jgi:hypothetical protein
MSKVGAVRVIGRGLAYLAAVQINILLSARIVELMESRESTGAIPTKEGTVRALNSASVNLSHLNPERVSYEPKNIHTEAIQVTAENIGKLSLEFEEELFFDSVGNPYFMFTAEREGQESSELYVHLTNWIIPLRGELHRFTDEIFTSTFTFDYPRKMNATQHAMTPDQMQFVPGSSGMKLDPSLSPSTDFRLVPGEQGLPGTNVKPSPTPRELPPKPVIPPKMDGPSVDWRDKP